METRYKVFVGNLPYSISEAALKDVFMKAGEFEQEDILDVIILKEKSVDPSRPPRSRGIGFVEFSSQEKMQQAIDRVNGTEVDYEVRGEAMKRPIFVNEARPFVPKEERSAY